MIRLSSSLALSPDRGYRQREPRHLAAAVTASRAVEGEQVCWFGIAVPRVGRDEVIWRSAVAGRYEGRRRAAGHGKFSGDGSEYKERSVVPARAKKTSNGALPPAASTRWWIWSCRECRCREREDFVVSRSMPVETDAVPSGPSGYDYEHAEVEEVPHRCCNVN